MARYAREWKFITQQELIDFVAKKKWSGAELSRRIGLHPTASSNWLGRGRGRFTLSERSNGAD